MRLLDFEDWFATIVEGEKETWAGWLKYSVSNGISLDVASYSSPTFWYSHPAFERTILTGYLDHQRPTTLVGTFVSSARPGSMGLDTPYVRVRYEVYANGILKNIHLDSLEEKCFIGLEVELPVFSAWIAPTFTSLSSESVDAPVADSGEKRSLAESYCLKNGGTATVSVRTINTSHESRSKRVTLNIHFGQAMNYDEVMRIQAQIEIMFSFLIGVRLDSAVYKFATNKNRNWLDSEEKIVAESWIRPVWKRAQFAPSVGDRIFTQYTSPVSTAELLNFCLLPGNDDIRYLMGTILSAEMEDVRSDDCFIELLGCLEDFDRSRNGSGRDDRINRSVRRIRNFLSLQKADSEAKSVFERLHSRFYNAYSLSERLERLMAPWIADGFRGRPLIKRLVALRNLKPHGRGRDISAESYREMAISLQFLCALARYHVLKELGFDRGAIAAGLSRRLMRYGRFVPRDFFSQPSA